MTRYLPVAVQLIVLLSLVAAKVRVGDVGLELLGPVGRDGGSRNLEESQGTPNPLTTRAGPGSGQRRQPQGRERRWSASSDKIEIAGKGGAASKASERIIPIPRVP